MAPGLEYFTSDQRQKSSRVGLNVQLSSSLRSHRATESTRLSILLINANQKGLRKAGILGQLLQVTYQLMQLWNALSDLRIISF